MFDLYTWSPYTPGIQVLLISPGPINLIAANSDIWNGLYVTNTEKKYFCN